MKETDQKLDILLAKAGQLNTYQFQVTILFLIQLTCSEFFNQCLPFLERTPYVFVNDSKESVLINYKICKNKNNIYILDENKIPNSIVMDFDIYCKESRIVFLGLMIYLGMIIGSCSSFLFADKIGRKKTLIIFVPIQIIFLCTFSILKPSLGNYCLTLVYINTFLLGICSHIIIITMIIYICEIIKQTNIPIFVILILTGVPLSNLLGTLLFNIKYLDWRYVLLIIAGIDLIIYLFIVFKLVGSPIFSLNNELFETFVFDLIELGKKNGIKLSLIDFDFLNPYMTRESRQTIYNKFMKEINEINTNLIINKDTDSNTNSNKEEDYLSSNKETSSKTALKDDYLLSSDVNLLKLFGKLKMKDYSPIDLIRYEKQTKNFLILSFLWLVTMVIKCGTNLQSKKIQKMNEEIYWSVIEYLCEIVSYFLMLILYVKLNIEFHASLIMLQIISFMIFMIILYLDLTEYEFHEIILLYSGRLCWSCVFALLSVITAIIYPIMIRTKGLGWNKSFGFIGAIISIIIIEFMEIKHALSIFLILEFFTMTLSYGLPKKIGTFILESPNDIQEQKDKLKKKQKELIEKNSLDNSDFSNISDSIFIEK